MLFVILITHCLDHHVAILDSLVQVSSALRGSRSLRVRAARRIEGISFGLSILQHASTPKIHVGQQGISSVTRDTTTVLSCRSMATHTKVLNRIKVGNKRVEHVQARRLGQLAIHRLSIGADRLHHQRYIAESTHEIEIVQSAQRLGLSNILHLLALGQAEVALCHQRSVFNHLVAIVDGCIERCPAEHAFRIFKDGILVIHETGIAHVFQHSIVGAGLTPKQHFADQISVGHLLIASHHGVLQVALVLPELLFCDGVRRIERQEIFARGQAPKKKTATSYQCQYLIRFHT